MPVRRNNVRVTRDRRFAPANPGEADILLDAPLLEAQNLVLEIENLELANLIRIGKVRLEVESLDADLFLQTNLGDLLHTLNRLASTVDLGLSLFFAPVYNFNRAADAWYANLDLARRWFELPVRMMEGHPRPERRPARPVDSPETRQAMRHVVSRDGDIIATVSDGSGRILEEEVVGRLKFSPQQEPVEPTGEKDPEPPETARRSFGRVTGRHLGRTIERTLNEHGEVIEERLLPENEEKENQRKDG